MPQKGGSLNFRSSPSLVSGCSTIPTPLALYTVLLISTVLR
ncbi:hypothetical protein ACFRJ9_05285 [Paenarthrobacter sp. NPDC056912]